MDAKDKHGETPFFMATEREYRETMKILIRHGANVNTRDNKGRTPLHMVTGQSKRFLYFSDKFRFFFSYTK